MLQIFAYIYHARLAPHIPDCGHISKLLLNKGALEHDEHDEGENTVVPVLVQTPQSDAENLEDKERSDRTFLEELSKLGHNHFQSERRSSIDKSSKWSKAERDALVQAIFRLSLGDFLFVAVAFPVAIMLYGMVGGKLQASEMLLVRIPNVLRLLEGEPDLLRIRAE